MYLIFNSIYNNKNFEIVVKSEVLYCLSGIQSVAEVVRRGVVYRLRWFGNFGYLECKNRDD